MAFVIFGSRVGLFNIFVILTAFRYTAVRGSFSGSREHGRRGHHLRDDIDKVAKGLEGNFLRYSYPGHERRPPKLDIIIALDSSKNSTVFQYQRKLSARLLDAFSLSPSTARAAVVSCADTWAHFNFDFQTHVNKEATLQFIPTLRQLKKPHGLGSCLHSIYYNTFGKQNTTRTDAKKLLFLVTNGRTSKSNVSIRVSAQQLKTRGVKIYGLNVGTDNEAYRQMVRTVSSPAIDHAFRVFDLGDLDKLMQKLQGKGAYAKCRKSKKPVRDECRRRCECLQGKMRNCTRVRKNFLSMSLKERRRFLRAVKTVTTDEQFKKEYEDLVKPHRNYFNKFVFEPRYFLPWQRVFLLKMENLLRRVDCRVTVPYWDWSQTSGVLCRADEFGLWSAEDYGIGGNGHAPDMCVTSGPFTKGSWYIRSSGNGTECLKRKFNCETQLPSEWVIQTALNTTSFHDFELMTRSFHHVVTCAIGGTSCSQDNARAPEYLLIASFIDKLWGDWQRKKRTNWPVGFPVVSSLLPGFMTYTGEVLQLSRQPGVVSVSYETSKGRVTSRRTKEKVFTESAGELLFDENFHHASRLYGLRKTEQEHLKKIFMNEDAMDRND